MIFLRIKGEKIGRGKFFFLSLVAWILKKLADDEIIAEWEHCKFNKVTFNPDSVFPWIADESRFQLEQKTVSGKTVEEELKLGNDNILTI